MFQVDNPRVVIECVKRADDGKGVIVRIYNSSDAVEKAVLGTTLAYNRVMEADLLENSLGATALSMELHPFEIAAFRFE